MDNNQNGYTSEQGGEGNNQSPLYTQTYMEMKSRNRGFAVASLVLGILSIVCCCLSYASLAMAILAVVFAVISKARMGYFDPLAVAGLVLGIIGIVFGAAVVLLDILSRMGLFADLNEMFNEMMPPEGEL